MDNPLGYDFDRFKFNHEFDLLSFTIFFYAGGPHFVRDFVTIIFEHLNLALT